MAWSEAEYLSLKAAVASGVLMVRYDDRTVQYQSLAEMRSLLASMEAELNPSGKGTRYRFAVTKKGF